MCWFTLESEVAAGNREVTSTEKGGVIYLDISICISDYSGTCKLPMPQMLFQYSEWLQGEVSCGDAL